MSHMSDEYELAALRQRVQRLEAQMAFLMRDLGVAYPDMPDWTPSPEVAELVVKGDTKGAIRLLREQTGASLKDAKEMVDQMRRGGLPRTIT